MSQKTIEVAMEALYDEDWVPPYSASVRDYPDITELQLADAQAGQRNRDSIARVIDAITPIILTEERARLAELWTKDSHAVRFNHDGDDLSPHQRVVKWLRNGGRS